MQFLYKMKLTLPCTKSSIFYLPHFDKHSETRVACLEKTAKLIPFSATDTPSGEATPREYFNGVSVSNISEVFSYVKLQTSSMTSGIYLISLCCIL